MAKFGEKNIAELIRFATAMTGSEDEGKDLVSSAIDKILTKYPDVKDSAEFLKLSYRIIKNEYIDIKRSKKRTVSIDDLGNIGNNNPLDSGDDNLSILDYITYKTRDWDEEVRIKTMDAEEGMIENEFKISKKKQYEIAQLCLSILNNETQKSVLTLFSDGLKYNEIANRLDIPTGTVKSSLLRARMKVAECIKKRLKNEK